MVLYRSNAERKHWWEHKKNAYMFYEMDGDPEQVFRFYSEKEMLDLNADGYKLIDILCRVEDYTLY
jgi:hypothetical protein